MMQTSNPIPSLDWLFQEQYLQPTEKGPRHIHRRGDFLLVEAPATWGVRSVWIAKEHKIVARVHQTPTGNWVSHYDSVAWEFVCEEPAK